MKILFIASMAIVTPDPAQSRKLFMDALGLPLKPHEGSDYYFSENIGGSKHFGEESHSGAGNSSTFTLP